MSFKLPGDLFSYQKEDLERLLTSKENFLNLSEMGTGKTPVAIGLSRHYPKTLVICPKSLRLEWSRQIQEWTGINPTVSKKGCYRRLEPLFMDLISKNPNPYFIVNYETFRTRRHLDLLNDFPFDLIIMDEAHRLRNPNRNMFKGIYEFLIHHRDSRVLLLTGSPIVNNPADLHSLLRLVRPDTFRRENRSDFLDKFSVTAEKSFLKCRNCGRVIYNPHASLCTYCGNPDLKTIVSKKPTGLKNEGQLREMTRPYSIRRTKSECLPYLPEKYYRKVILEMPKDQRNLYKQMEDELFVLLDDGQPLWAPNVLSLLTRLRQLNLEPNILGLSSGSAKTDFLKETLDSTEEKFVIYSCFEKYIQFLHYNLPHKHVLLVGSTGDEERAYNVKCFQEDPSIKLLMATVGPSSPGGEGITLTSASNVILTDRWWTPTTNTQAEDRLHRIGQKNAVQVILPVCEKSIDQSLDKILEAKKRFSQEFFDERDIMREVIDDLRFQREEYKNIPEEEDDNGDPKEEED